MPRWVPFISHWGPGLGLVLAAVGCRFGYDEIPLAIARAGAGSDETPRGGMGATTAIAGSGGAASGGALSAGGAAGVGGAAGGGAPNDGGAGGIAAEGGAPPEDTPPTALPCATPLSWSADFSSDPTTRDDNGDGQPDWAWLAGGVFPTQQLAGGVWSAQAGCNLATFPPGNFVAATYVRVVFRDRNPPHPVPANGFDGALAWINVDYTATSLVPVFVSVIRRDAMAQELSLFGKADANDEVVRLVGPFDIGAEAFVTVVLRIHPEVGKIWMWSDGVYRGVTDFHRGGPYNNDRFANLHVPTGNADFDEFAVESCGVE